jgi:hypothetical protein
VGPPFLPRARIAAAARNAPYPRLAAEGLARGGGAPPAPASARGGRVPFVSGSLGVLARGGRASASLLAAEQPRRSRNRLPLRPAASVRGGGVPFTSSALGVLTRGEAAPTEPRPTSPALGGLSVLARGTRASASLLTAEQPQSASPVPGGGRARCSGGAAPRGARAAPEASGAAPGGARARPAGRGRARGQLPFLRRTR